MVDDVTFCSSMANVGEFYIGGGYKNRQFAKINPSPIFRVIRYALYIRVYYIRVYALHFGVHVTLRYTLHFRVYTLHLGVHFTLGCTLTLGYALYIWVYTSIRVYTLHYGVHFTLECMCHYGRLCIFYYGIRAGLGYACYIRVYT